MFKDFLESFKEIVKVLIVRILSVSLKVMTSYFKLSELIVNCISNKLTSFFEYFINSKNKNKAVFVCTQLIILFVIIGILVGLVSLHFALSKSLLSIASIVNGVLIFFAATIFFTLLITITNDKDEMKTIAEFCNKSILPFITVVIMVFGLPNPNSNTFSVLNPENNINFLEIYIQVTPLLFTVIINLKLLWISLNTPTGSN